MYKKLDGILQCVILRHCTCKVKKKNPTFSACTMLFRQLLCPIFVAISISTQAHMTLRSLQMKEYITNNNTPVFPQPPYFPDLIVVDCYKFPKVKLLLKGVGSFRPKMRRRALCILCPDHTDIYFICIFFDL